jgi:hypothetical protein
MVPPEATAKSRSKAFDRAPSLVAAFIVATIILLPGTDLVVPDGSGSRSALVTASPKVRAVGSQKSAIEQTQAFETIALVLHSFERVAPETTQTCC